MSDWSLLLSCKLLHGSVVTQEVAALANDIELRVTPFSDDAAFEAEMAAFKAKL